MKNKKTDFPGSQWVRICLPANAGDTGSVPGLGRLHTSQTAKPGCRNF